MRSEDEALERLFQDVMYDPKFNMRDRNDLICEIENLDPTHHELCDMIVRMEKTFGGK